MKKFLLGIATLLAFSCSGDDDGPAAPKQLLSKMTITHSDNDPTTYAVAYDSENRVKSVVKNDGETTTYTYAYNDDNLVGEVRITGNENSIMICNYDSSKRLTSLVYNGENNPVTYSPATNTYSLGSLVTTLQPDGNVSSVSFLTFTYDASKKGSLFGVKGNFQFINSFTDLNIVIMGAARPVTAIGVPAGTDYSYSINNEFDDKDYITKLTLVQEGVNPSTSTYAYEYTSL